MQSKRSGPAKAKLQRERCWGTMVLLLLRISDHIPQRLCITTERSTYPGEGKCCSIVTKLLYKKIESRKKVMIRANLSE